MVLPVFVARAETEAWGDLDPAAAPAGSLLTLAQDVIETGASLLNNGMQDVLAGPDVPGLERQLSPRVQRALQASTLQPQQLVAWLGSMVAATRALFRLKGGWAMPLHRVCCRWHARSYLQHDTSVRQRFHGWLAVQVLAVAGSCNMCVALQHSCSQQTNALSCAALCCAGDQALSAYVLKMMIDVWRLEGLASAQLVESTSLQAEVFSLLVDCTLAMRRRLEAAGPEALKLEDVRRLLVIAPGISDAGMCNARRQVGGHAG